MFFLFSDVLLETRPSGALSLSSGQRFHVRRVFPLADCAVDKVFGHTRGQGGLLSLSFPKAKLLLMSSDQDDFNDWNSCLTSAVRKFQSKPTVIHDKVCVGVCESSGAPHRKRPAVRRT
ncbi:hypothetical protein NL108_017166 [Boleophthalmus pectinirostris]|nr:hypothetical protein NL108_017166 [Boleophthalmus pectinirostris]